MWGLTQKNSFGNLNIIVLDVDVCYSTQSDLPGPLKVILTQWPAVPYLFQTAEWGTAEARAYILKTYPRIWKKKKQNKQKKLNKLLTRGRMGSALWTQSKKIQKSCNNLKDGKTQTLKKKPCRGKPIEDVKHYNGQTDHIFPNHRTKSNLRQKQRPYL